jgi:hypothetical protein
MGLGVAISQFSAVNMLESSLKSGSELNAQTGISGEENGAMRGIPFLQVFSRQPTMV